jgi:hypothetical protein
MITAGLGRIIDVMAVKPPDRVAVLEDIRTLAAAPSPLIEQVERTLADGYACALAIEAERLRLQRQLEQAAASLGQGSGLDRVGELAGLGQGLVRTSDELAELRTALAELAAMARRLRAA